MSAPLDEWRLTVRFPFRYDSVLLEDAIERAVGRKAESAGTDFSERDMSFYGFKDRKAILMARWRLRKLRASTLTIEIWFNGIKVVI
jgi:hypothetical protein